MSRQPRELPWRPRSLQARQLMAASLFLLGFLALAGYALDRAFLDVASDGQRDRLRSYAYAYAADIDFLRSGEIYVPEIPPDSRLDQPGSGLYAEVVLADRAWRSPSANGPQLPQASVLEGHEETFEGPLPMVTAKGLPAEVYRYGLGLVWETSNGDETREIPYTIYVMEDAGTVPEQVRVFRAALWGYLGVSGAILLFLQVLVLRWSLWPLRRVVAELKRVQRGQADRMGERHPRELEPLADSINALIESERENLEQQRNTLADLAHSLKTPLAVLRARLDSDAGDADLREEVATQLQRMNDLVSYQLGRAASGGHQLFAAPVEIEPHAEQIVRGLEKIYARKGVICEFEIDGQARFHGEPGDLQELLGNLLENAFKWAGSRVLLTVRTGETAPNRRPGLMIVVEDDGPGIPEERIALVLQRGVRGDERVHGHGIGLSIVQDIVRSYRGTLDVGRSDEFGGACFSVTLPPGL